MPKLIQHYLKLFAHINKINRIFGSGTAAAAAGDDGVAVSYFKTALEEFSDYPGITPIVLAQILGNLGNCYFRQGKYEIALKYQADAEKMFADVHFDLHHDLLISRVSLLNTLIIFGRHEEVAILLEKSLKTAKNLTGKYLKLRASAFNSFGIAKMETENYDEALKYFNESLKLRKAFNRDPLDLLITLSNISNLETTRGNPEEGLILIEECLKIIRDQHIENEISAGVSYNYARTLTDLKRFDESLDIYENSLDLYRLYSPKHPRLALIKYGWATSLFGLHRHLEAREKYEDALAVLQAIVPAEADLMIMTFERLAEIAEVLGEDVLAVQHRQNALTSRIELFLVRSQLMKSHLRSNETNKIKSDLAQLTTAILELSGDSLIQRLLECQIDLHLSVKGLETALTSLRPTLVAQATGPYRLLLESWFEKRDALARLWNATSAESLAMIRQLREDIASLQEQIARHEEGNGLTQALGLRRITGSSVAAVLRCGETFFNFDVLGEAIFLTVIPQKGRASIRKLDIPVSAVQAAVNYVHAWASGQITAQNVLFDPAVFLLLFKSLLAPSEVNLKPDEELPSLVICGDGPLYHVPWDLLRDERRPRAPRLVDLAAVRLIPTPRDFVRLDSRPSPSTGSSLMVGVRQLTAGASGVAPFPSVPAPVAQSPSSRSDIQPTTAPSTYSDLRYAEEEIFAVSRLLDAVGQPHVCLPSDGRRPNRQGIQEVLGRPYILHFAAHSDVWSAEQSCVMDRRQAADPNDPTCDPTHPFSRAVLLLEGAEADMANGTLDNVLRAWELSMLQLSGTTLVVFSSCHSGAVEQTQGDGLAGLAMATFLAGAERTLSTLWAVVDREAAIFVWAVYHQWLTQPGATVQQALITVKRACSRAEQVSNWDGETTIIPERVWAAYVLNGLA